MSRELTTADRIGNETVREESGVQSMAGVSKLEGSCRKNREASYKLSIRKEKNTYGELTKVLDLMGEKKIMYSHA